MEENKNPMPSDREGPIKLFDPSKTRFGTPDRLYRDGVELEKGVIITEDFMERNQEMIVRNLELFTAYPDILLDIIKPTDSNFDLFPYQRLFLRVCMRYRDIYFTATRAASKTFLSILAKYMQCMLIPGHKAFIAAPNKQQAAKVSQQKLEEIWRIYPVLKLAVQKYNSGKDYTEVYFKGGGKFSVTGALDSSRGERSHSGLIDEARKIE